MSKLPRRISKPLDDDVVMAVQILNEAVKDVRVPGVKEFTVVTSALQRVIDERRSGDLLVAGAAFDQLDKKARADIAERAVDRAADYRAAQERGPQRQTPIAAPSAVAKSPSAKATRGAPLISAMAGILRRNG